MAVDLWPQSAAAMPDPTTRSSKPRHATSPPELEYTANRTMRAAKRRRWRCMPSSAASLCLALTVESNISASDHKQQHDRAKEHVQCSAH